MTRAEALAACIALVEAGQPEVEWPASLDTPLGRDAVDRFYDAFVYGHLDEVADLEAPLRDRGWRGPWTYPCVENGSGAAWDRGGSMEEPVIGEAPSEARARLLAVLRALLSEASQ